MWKLPPPLWKPVPWAWSPLAKRPIMILALAGLLVVLITGLALGRRPQRRGDRHRGDVAAKTPGSPTAG